MSQRFPSRFRRMVSLVLPACLAISALQTRADAYDEAPIHYSQSTPTGAVADLADKMARGEARLQYDQRTGYLESLLKALNIPISSQTLVFSKTSLQRERISPTHPRALYFNDDIYVGYVSGGEVIEVTAADPKLGMVFYSLDQRPQGRAQFVRQTDNCLQCHASSMTRNIPGLLLRSVRPDDRGFPILRAGTHLVTHESPLAKRWGGWYVTGTHGRQEHMGNTFWEDIGEGEVEPMPDQATQNITDLSSRFDTTHYLSPHSDIVALMVFEHQAEGHNLITRANFGALQALHDAKVMNEALKRPADFMSDSTRSRIRSTAEPLVKYLLFCGEAKLTEELKGTSGFAEEFAQLGPRDSKGRSLRDFDLRGRIFKYPLSYLIYTPSFDALPEPTRQYVYGRLHEVLTNQDQSKEFAHLSAEDRRACLEILLETKPNLPADWRRDRGQ